MTPEQLKASIYNYALQGKLVEQRIKEGTALQLLSDLRISLTDAEVDSEDSLFEIPENWKWIRFGSIIRIISGTSYKKNDVKISGTRVLRGGNIQDGKILVFDDDVYLDDEYYSDEKQVRIGDTVIVASTGSKTVIGKPGFVKCDVKKTVIGAFLRICRPLDSCLTEYIQMIFSSDYYRKHIRDSVKGTNINNIKESHISELAIPLPPLEEQHRIVAKIEELLPLVNRYTEAYEKLEKFNAKFPEDMKKSILQYAIQGKLVEQRAEEGTAEELYQQIQEEKQKLIAEKKIKKEKPLAEITEDEIPFDIPESWKWVRLGEAYWYIDAGKSPNCQKIPVAENQWGVITTTAIQQGYFDEQQNKVLPESFVVNKEMQVRVNDILITRAGPMNRTGVSCKVKSVNHNLILSDKTLRINMTDKYVCKDFVVMLLNSPQIRNMLIDRMSGMDKQQVNISQDKFKSVLLPLPPLEEQKRIVAKIEELLPYCDRLIK